MQATPDPSADRRAPTRRAARVAGAVGVVVLIAFVALGGSGRPAAPGVASTSPDTTPGPTTPTSPATGGDDAWHLADAVARRLDHTWRHQRGAYAERSVRTNAMMLELHARAAEAGHEGPARNDARARRMVAFLTRPPIFVCRTTTKRSQAIFPHTPAFAAICVANASRAPLHPSADAIVARGLAAAYRARGALHLGAGTRRLIRTTVAAVARGPFYRTGQRAENQINWNADVLMADYAINGSRASLGRYRAQLLWFARRLTVPVRPGGSTNASPGGALRYWPEQPETHRMNRVGSAEYANVIRSALGWYGVARAAGMPALPAWAHARLWRWSMQVALGTWTHAGYLNWDTGHGSRRRFLRQYWGLALQGFIAGSRAGGIGATPALRAWTARVSTQADALFRTTVWNGRGPLPAATSFGAPNGFPEATSNRVTAPLRFALADLDRRELLAGVTPSNPPLIVSHDAHAGRLAVTTPTYNAGFVREGPTIEGGLEPSRLFDGLQRPLTVLLADGIAGAAPDLRVVRGGVVVADSQPGHDHALPVAGPLGVSPWRVNRSANYPNGFAARGTAAGASASITVLHRFTSGSITTRYVVHGAGGARVVLRLPVWDTRSRIEPVDGATRGWRRTSGPLRIAVTTTQGASMQVTFRGLPRTARLMVVRGRPSGRAPRGTRTLVISLPGAAAHGLERRMVVAAPTA